MTVSQECEAAVRARAVLAALSPSDTSQRHIDPMQSCGHFTQTRIGLTLSNSDLKLGFPLQLRNLNVGTKVEMLTENDPKYLLF